MLMKLCKCGRRIPQGQTCPCQKQRHQIYDETRRDPAKRDFYHSVEWKKISAIVKSRANGLDEYRLAFEGVMEVGSTAHHIYTLEERPDLKTSLSNLIFVSAKTHNKIHAEYNKGESTKRALQSKLLALRKVMPSLIRPSTIAPLLTEAVASPPPADDAGGAPASF